MNRWNEEFKKIQGSWIETTQNLSSLKREPIDDNDSNIEFNRAESVILLIDSFLKNFDPNLIPLSFFPQASKSLNLINSDLTNYSKLKQLQTLRQLNNELDSLLTLIYPYFISNKVLNEVKEESINSYNERISKAVSNLLANIENSKEELERKNSEINSIYDDIILIKNSSNEFAEGLLEDYSKENNTSIESKINEIKSQIERYESEINDFYTRVFQGEDSLKAEMEDVKNLAHETLEKIKISYKDSSDQLKELIGYHNRVFQNTVDEDGKVIKRALKEEIDIQKERYKALNDQIENLLPGATSAGLATAYHDLNISYDKPIKIYTIIFYVSLAVLITLSLMLSVSSITWSPFSIKLIEHKTLESLVSALIIKLPILLPAIWLAFFSSNRRKESERLKQEYAHKEALAKSYQSFKLQIDQLGSEKQEPLLEKLLTVAIDTIGMNASSTLDKHNKSDLPSAEMSKSIIDIVKNK